MAKNIRGIFEEFCGDIKIDKRFVRMLRQLRLSFVNRNSDHVQFFGGNLLGVHPVRYRTSDREQWYDEVIEANESDLVESIRDLDSIDPTWVRASDPVNLSSVWLVYRIHNTSSLSARDKEQAILDVLLMLQYKFISSIMSHFFPYPADHSVAVATYEALSKKFDLKKYGSWQALLEARSESIMARSSIHYTTYTKMTDDDAVIYMVSDIQARLREIVKKTSAVFYRVKEQNLRISSTSSTIEIDGMSELLDRQRDHSRYTRYLHSVISDKPTFIRQELIDVVGDVLHTMPERYLKETLSFCSDNYGGRGDPRIEKLIDEVLLHAYDYLSNNRGIMSGPSDLGSLITKLRNIYMASRMSDPALISMRDLADGIVDDSISSRNKAVVASVRTGLQVYIVLRAFAMNHYN
jgi:hypothetical protein